MLSLADRIKALPSIPDANGAECVPREVVLLMVEGLAAEWRGKCKFPEDCDRHICDWCNYAHCSEQLAGGAAEPAMSTEELRGRALRYYGMAETVFVFTSRELRTLKHATAADTLAVEENASGSRGASPKRGSGGNMKRKAKFRVGQVICEKMTGLYRRIHTVQQVGPTFWYGLLRRDGVDYCIDESTLRGLRTREKGQST